MTPVHKRPVVVTEPSTKDIAAKAALEMIKQRRAAKQSSNGGTTNTNNNNSSPAMNHAALTSLPTVDGEKNLRRTAFRQRNLYVTTKMAAKRQELFGFLDAIPGGGNSVPAPAPVLATSEAAKHGAETYTRAATQNHRIKKSPRPAAFMKAALKTKKSSRATKVVPPIVKLASNTKVRPVTKNLGTVTKAAPASVPPAAASSCPRATTGENKVKKTDYINWLGHRVPKKQWTVRNLADAADAKHNSN